MIDKHWRKDALAERLGVTVEQIEHATELGDLVPVKLGRTLFYKESEALRWAMFPNRGKETRIYFIQEGEDGPVKVGESNSPDRRLIDHQCGNPRPLRLLGSFSGYAWQEREVHVRFVACRLRGEWYEPTPELLAYIDEACQ